MISTFLNMLPKVWSLMKPDSEGFSTEDDVAFLKAEIEELRRSRDAVATEARGYLDSVRALQAKLTLKDQRIKAVEAAHSRLLDGSRDAAERALRENNDLRRIIAGHKEELAAEERRVRMELGATPIRDKKGQIDASNNAQASRTMARQIKANFVEYQRAVTHLLDQLNELGKKNHITKEDLRRFGVIRRELGRQISRDI